MVFLKNSQNSQQNTFLQNTSERLLLKLEKFIVQNTLREEYPNTELFLVRIFLSSDRIQKNTDQN